MRQVLSVLAAVVAALLLAVPALAGPPAPSYVDATGSRLLYGLNARHIVSLAPNVTEMLCFLGLRERMVGRSDYCNYPPEVQRLPSVGGFADSSLEKIVALSPDLVIAYQGNSRELVQLLRAAKIRVLAFNEARSLPEIGDQMTVIWRIAAGGNAKDPRQLADWRARLAKLSLPLQGARPSVFFGYPGEMSMSCAPGSFLGDLIGRAGGANVVGESSQRWPMVSAEFIVGAQPEWLLTATACTAKEDASAKQAALLAQLQADPVWSALPAVQSGRLCVIESDVLLRPGPRVLDALAILRGRLAGGTAN